MSRTGNWLDPVRRSLDVYDGPVDLFIRDDDVGWDDIRLWRLLDLIATHALPADLAVIPNELTESLARSLLARPNWLRARFRFTSMGARTSITSPPVVSTSSALRGADGSSGETL